MTVSEPVDVAIIGAGISGLTAAWALTSASHSVVCLEGRDRVGGRAHTRQTPLGPVDLGATWFWSMEATVQDLAPQLGAAVFAQHTAGDGVFENTDRVPRRLEGNPIDSPAFRFADGAQSLAERIRAQLPDDAVLLGHAVTDIDTTAERVRVSGPGFEIDARSVILAAAPAALIDTVRFSPALDDDVLELARTTPTWMGDMIKAVAVYDQPFWRAVGLAGSAFSYAGPFSEFHDLSGPDAAPAALFGFAPTAQFPDGIDDDELGRLFVDQLARLFGLRAASPAHVEVVNWAAEPFTTPSAPLPHASTARYGHPLFLEGAAAGRIQWASTETATESAGHLEGALRAGMRAAAGLLNGTLL
jgi:monoamine oxidase